MDFFRERENEEGLAGRKCGHNVGRHAVDKCGVVDLNVRSRSDEDGKPFS